MKAAIQTTWLASMLLLIPPHARAASILYSCDFPRWSDNTGNFRTKERFGMRFAYDNATGQAVMLGNLGMEKVAVVTGSDGITFLERLVTGAVQSTTITNKGTAVHSRHSMILGDLTPSQYYGTCTRQQGNQ